MQIESRFQPHRQTLVRSTAPDSEEARIAARLIEASDIEDSHRAQLETDLTAFPTPWLRRFQKEDVSVAVLKDNQTLADTPLLRSLSESEIQELVAQTQPLVQGAVAEIFGPLEGIADPGEREYSKRMASGDLQDKLHELSDQAGAGFALEVDGQTRSLEYIGQSKGFDPEYDPEGFSRWKQAFLDVNQGLIHEQDGQITPEHGVYVMPYVMHKGKTVRALTLPSYQALTGMQMAQNHGANIPENRLVVLHDSVLPNPSPLHGHHRVALHELGHMMDWICKELPETRDTHEAKVQQLYQTGVERMRSQQGPNPFLTPRAVDSPGEMMAEAVEAYLTVPEGDAANRYKAENHRDNLQQAFPELYQYVDFMMHIP